MERGVGRASNPTGAGMVRRRSLDEVHMTTKNAVSSGSGVQAANAVNPTGAAAPSPGSTGGGGTVPGGIPVTGLKGLRAALSAMAQGWGSALPAGLVLPSNTGGYNQATILSQLNGWLALYQAADTARRSLAGTLAQLQAQEPAIRAELAQLKVALKAFFGTGSPELAQFGLKPSKPKAKLSGEKLAIRAARSQQTRDIRGTRGKKQKADLKSTGPLEVTVAPPAAAAKQSVAVAAAVAPAAVVTPEVTPANGAPQKTGA